MVYSDYVHPEHNNRFFLIEGNGSLTNSHFFYFQTMTKKAVVYFYGDICCVDDTEILYDKRDQLADIVVAMLKASSEAKTAEAYDAATNNLILKYNITRNGKVSKMRTSRRGGSRPGAGRKSKGRESIQHIITLRVNADTYDYLQSLPDKSLWIRAAIAEKLERDNNTATGQS